MEERTMSAEAVDEYVLRPVDVDKDAEKLAEMWRKSDDQWPGTWSRGVPVTGQMLREWLEREKRIEALVWDTGDAIAGYCSLWEWLEEPNVSYIALLNVAPGFQKKSLARKFLTHYVERVIELGSIRLDLHTWSGNLKAVPLYKKCGFFWLPGTSVHMLNFMPAILRMPIAQPFFAKHDWYRTFKRALTQDEDDERWEGMKVFTYHFEAGGDHLTVWADREALRITAVEIDDFFAAAITDDQEPSRGLPATIRWKLANKRDQPMQVSLIATGTEHLKLDHRDAVQLAPGQTVTLEASVAVSIDAPEVEDGKPAPFVKSLLIVDGQTLELGTGLRPRAAVEVKTIPQDVTLLPGVPRTVELQLHSRLKQEVEATVSLAPEKGLTANWTQQTLTLAPEAYGGYPVELCAQESGVFELAISIAARLDGDTIHLPAAPRAVFSLPPGGVLGAEVDGKLRIENEKMRLLMRQQGAELTIVDRATDKWLGFHFGYSGPPFRPSEYWEGKFDLTIEHHAGRLVAVASMPSRDNPDFVLRKRVTVGAGQVFSVDYDFENLGPERRRFQLTQWVGGNNQKAMITLPFAAGLVRAPWSEFPGPFDDELNRAAAYAEQWTSLEYDEATIGVVWAGDVEEVEFGWGIEALTRFYDCPPQSRVRPQSLHVYAGDGDWRAVRRLWQRLAGRPSTPDEPMPEPRAPLVARTEPPVIVTANGAVEASLIVEHHVARRFSGSASLMLPADWQADNTEMALADVYWRQPFCSELHLTTTARPGAATGTITIRSDEVDVDFAVPLIRLGDERPVEVHVDERDDQPVWTIDNGRVEIDVTPAFAGAVSALREGGVNHLFSPFPKPGALGWLAPWYGGLTPVVAVGDGGVSASKLRQETFVAEPLSLDDGRGITWRGVRQRAVLSEEALRDLTLEIDTLTVGGSPVVKQVMRLINSTPVTRRLETAGFVAFTQPDGSYSRTTLWGPEARKHRERMYSAHAGHWAAAQNPDTHRALALVSPRPGIAALGWGRDGGHFQLLTNLAVPANGSSEVVGYLVLADGIESARRYAALKDYV
jgi:GNAT superfamily N-acetyltransferase